MAIDPAEKLRVPNIGDRIECNGHFGTIKYIGSVESHPSTWLGIDWDDPERGKHDGTVKGRHYFDARYNIDSMFIVEHTLG